MIKQSLRLAGWATSLLTLAATASADVKLNDNFSVGGYSVGSYQYTKWKGSPATDRFDLDAVKTEVRLGGELILRERFEQSGADLKALAALAGSGPKACFGNAVLVAEGEAPWRRCMARACGWGSAHCAAAAGASSLSPRTASGCGKRCTTCGKLWRRTIRRWPVPRGNSEVY